MGGTCGFNSTGWCDDNACVLNGCKAKSLTPDDKPSAKNLENVEVPEIKYGWLTVLDKVKGRNGKVSCFCKCICGETVRVPLHRLTSGHKKSCGCLRRSAHLSRRQTSRIAVGTTVGHWTVLAFRVDELSALCRCVCGEMSHVWTNNLRHNKTLSCGCRGIPEELLYRKERTTWECMKQRCDNPKSSAYAHYGARGISVCSEWQSDFKAFVRDMGPRPPGASIERIDVNGNYEPGNCKWIPRSKQSSNTRRTRRLNINGEELCLSDAARKAGMTPNTLRARLRYGWDLNRALTDPVMSKLK